VQPNCFPSKKCVIRRFASPYVSVDELLQQLFRNEEALDDHLPSALSLQTLIKVSNTLPPSKTAIQSHKDRQSSHARTMSSTTGPKPPPSNTLPQRQQQQITQRGPTGGLRTPSNRKTIYDRNLNRSRTAELSRASFAYLFGEMVSYAQKRVTGIQDLERRSARPCPPLPHSPRISPRLTWPPRLNEQGHPLGLRLLDLLLYRPGPCTSSRSSSSSRRPSGDISSLVPPTL